MGDRAGKIEGGKTMTILFFILAVLLIGGGFALTYQERDFLDAITIFFIIGALLLVISIIMACVNVSSVIDGRTYAKKIDMYQSENNSIERKVDLVVTNYMKHEERTFDTAKSDSAITLVSLYPKLKSDSLVKEQIKIYNKNTAKIRSLKERQINVSKAKWWLYFGG